MYFGHFYFFVSNNVFSLNSSSSSTNSLIQIITSQKISGILEIFFLAFSILMIYKTAIKCKMFIIFQNSIYNLFQRQPAYACNFSQAHKTNIAQTSDKCISKLGQSSVIVAQPQNEFFPSCGWHHQLQILKD